MRGLVFGLTVACAFLAGQVASQWTVPSAHAGTAAKWESACIQLAMNWDGSVDEKSAADMKAMGKAGWELATSFGWSGGGSKKPAMLCYKRSVN